MDGRQEQKAFWIVLLALLLLTRIPVLTSYFGIDNVNLAFALETFDPRVHQPQPPGYPFFVAYARVINFFFHDAAPTFAVITVLGSGLSVALVFVLGSRMFSPWAGAASALLLLVNPVFWHSASDANGGPLRLHLALFSLLIAYCCWRCWNGDKQFAIWSGVAFGIGSGFRPDLIAFLVPLWLTCLWVGTKSWRTVFKAIAILAATVAIWAGATIYAVGGFADFASFQQLLVDYAVNQSQPGSIVLGSASTGWLRQISRLAIWNSLAVVGWICAVPFWFRNRDRLPLIGSVGAFFFLWLVPGLLVQALIHVDAPGHTLFSIPALCLLGGFVLSQVRGKEMILSAALILNVALFLNFLAVPAGAAPAAGRSIKNAFIFGVTESSLGHARAMDEISRATLKEVAEFTAVERPTVIITTDTHEQNWFMNWRILRYYLPTQDVWVLYNRLPQKRAEAIRRHSRIDVRNTAPVKIPIFREGRILWLIEPGSPIHKEIATKQKLTGGRYVFYSDITPESPTFTIDEFEIVPSLFGFLPN